MYFRSGNSPFRPLLSSLLCCVSAGVVLLCVSTVDAVQLQEEPTPLCDPATDCQDCESIDGADGNCIAAQEVYETGLLSGTCTVQPNASPPTVLTDTCEGEGTTSWSGAYCSMAGISPENPEPPYCSRLWSKKDKHAWQAKAKVTGQIPNYDCECTAEFMTETDGAQCVKVCGS